MQEPLKDHLVVATLNYCGIMNNPYQFYCQEYEKELQEISQIFVKLIPLYFPNYKQGKCAWDMGKIDVKIRIGRYSPSFSLKVGIKTNNTFMTKEEFEQQWDKAFDELISQNPLVHKKEQRQQTRLYDFLFFHALLCYVYKQESFETLIKQQPDKYVEVIGPFYQLSFLSEEKKLQKTLSSFQNIEADVFFIQEYSPAFLAAIEKNGRYYISSDQTKDTLIIAKKNTFKVKYPTNMVLNLEQINSLSWAGRTAISIVDNYILLNVHLNSKKQKSEEQIASMKTELVKLKNRRPNYHIIVGGDLNSFMKADNGFEKIFKIFPENEEEVTTVKKRTMLQGQTHKGNKLVAESKDKILSTLKIVSGSIRYINNKEANSNSLIPSDQHPFDHLVLVAFLQKP